MGESLIARHDAPYLVWSLFILKAWVVVQSHCTTLPRVISATVPLRFILYCTPTLWVAPVPRMGLQGLLSFTSWQAPCLACVRQNLPFGMAYLEVCVRLVV